MDPINNNPFRQNAVRQRLILAAANEYAIFTTDLQRRVTSWNSRAQALFGYVEADMLGQLADRLYLPEDRRQGVPQLELEKALGEGRADNERWHLRRDSSRVYGSGVVTPLRDEAGTTIGLVKVMRDLTRQKRAEEALSQSEERFRAFVTATSDAVYQMSADWRQMHQFVGKSFLQDTTTTSPSWLELYIPPQDQHQVQTVIDGAIAARRPFELAHRIRRADGSLGWTFSRATPILDAQGEIAEWVGTTSDITERRANAQALQESEKRLRLAIEAAQMGTWEWDLENDEVYWNEQHFRLFGLEPRPNPLRPDDFFSYVRTDERGRVGGLLQAAIAQGGTFDTEFWAQLADGSQRYMSGYGRVIEERGGRAIRMNGVMFDVTERRGAEDALRQSEERYRHLSEVLEERVQARTQELRQANQDLKRSNENLQQFAYVASHDLQEPLRKIQSFGDILKKQYADSLGNGVDYLQRMQAAAGRMSTLIRDLLTYSRISTQQETTAPVSLNGVIVTVLNDQDLVIEETGAQVAVEPLPTVVGDSSQLGQLFQNLLANALKFGRADVAPAIAVRCQRVVATALPDAVRPTRRAAAYYRIEVSDNGIGFDEQYADRIFQVFQRLHGKGEYAGTGIGLAICQKVAANDGGAITATSQPGEGATFGVYLPA